MIAEKRGGGCLKPIPLNKLKSVWAHVCVCVFLGWVGVLNQCWAAARGC